MKNWKLTGFIATIVITLSIPAYYLKAEYGQTPQHKRGWEPPVTFAGSKKCMDCHKKEYDNWQNSHHDHAMEAANEDTVLGDFNDAVFEFHGIRAHFYRKNGRYFAHTRGPGGKMGDFERHQLLSEFSLEMKGYNLGQHGLFTRLS